MKKYFLSTHTDYSYNGIEHSERRDSLEFYDSVEECMSFAYQNLITDISHIDEMSKIKAYINHEMLSKPNVDWNITSGSIRCSVNKDDNVLTMSIEQGMIVEGKHTKLAIKYKFVPNEIDTESVGYVVYGIFDSDIHAYAERLSGEIFNTIADAMKYIDNIKQMKIKNLCDFTISVVDSLYVKNHSIDEYEKLKINKITI